MRPGWPPTMTSPSRRRRGAHAERHLADDRARRDRGGGTAVSLVNVFLTVSVPESSTPNHEPDSPFCITTCSSSKRITA